MKDKHIPRKTSDSSSLSYVLEDQIGFVLRLAAQFHTAIFTSRMVDTLTQTQFAALAAIFEVHSCSQSELGRLLLLDSATINGVVDRLYSRELIDIADDPTDRRRLSITLTQHGRRTAMRAREVGREITEDTLSNLTPTERSRLILLLRKMIGRRR